MYAGIILGPLAGLLSGIGVTINPDPHVTFPIMSAVAAFISGIVVAITKFGRFEEESSHHKIAASKYTSLESNVRRQLSINRANRINAGSYLEWVGKSFDELFSSSPFISNKIYKNYVNEAKKKGLTIPEEYGLTIYIDKNNQEKIPLRTSEHFIAKNFSNDDNNNNDNNNNTYSLESLKKTQNNIHEGELNKFSDGRMGYEINRMNGLK
jgi:hypothetical protein